LIGKEAVHKPGSSDELIIQAFARLDKMALGVSCGMTAGVLVFVATAVLILKGGSTIGPHLDLLNQYFIGYAVSWMKANLESTHKLIDHL